jgi:hypothetical protein
MSPELPHAQPSRVWDDVEGGTGGGMVKSLVLLLFAGPLACASVPLVVPQPTVPAFSAPRTDAELDARFHFLEERLDAGRRHAQIWYYGWLGFNTACFAYTTASATIDSSRSRSFDIVNAAQAAIGVGDLVFLRPMPGREGADPIRGPADASHADKVARLAKGEQILVAAAQRADDRSSWTNHLGNLAFNLLGGGILLALHESHYAAVATLSGTAVGEAYIWSEPSRAPEDLKEYRHFIADGAVTQSGDGTNWLVFLGGRGIALRVSF